MKFAKIYLIRHGEVINHNNIIYGYLPVPLNSRGRAQARKAGLFLKRKNIAAIYASPQRRCQQTAKIIKQKIGGKIKILINKNLRESGFGHLCEGLTMEEAARKYHKEHLFYTRTPAKAKAGERLMHQAQRMLKVINQGMKKYPGQNLAFVSHRDPILAVLLKISKRSFDDLHKVKPICDKGSICEIWSVGKKLINKTYLAN